MQLLMVLEEIAATFLKCFVIDVVKAPSHTIKPHHHLWKYLPFSFQINDISYLSAGCQQINPAEWVDSVRR